MWSMYSGWHYRCTLWTMVNSPEIVLEAHWFQFLWGLHICYKYPKCLHYHLGRLIHYHQKNQCFPLLFRSHAHKLLILVAIELSTSSIKCDAVLLSDILWGIFLSNLQSWGGINWPWTETTQEQSLLIAIIPWPYTHKAPLWMVVKCLSKLNWGGQQALLASQSPFNQ